jgi:hypothetical protein
MKQCQLTDETFSRAARRHPMTPGTNPPPLKK